MTAKIINGIQVSAAIREQMKQRVTNRLSQGLLKPRLAVLLVGAVIL
ncbi:MAG: hypothetical protein Q9M92_07495 [Enterobacterales bacterium]|nr:hypothetical protein [Enterobacterales bacterium]